MPDSQIKVSPWPSKEEAFLGKDLDTSNAARVSYGKMRKEFLYKGDPRVRPTGRADDELIYDLASEGHITPFGHNYCRFHIEAPVFVARQLVKHKFLRMSEVSRRYVDTEPEFFTPDVWRGKAKDKKQGSDGEIAIHEDTFGFGADYEYWIEHEDVCKETYQRLLEQGVAPEQARMVLPQSMMTQWVWSGSLDAFANMVNLRIKPDAQYETRLVAQQIDTYMREIYPVSWGALVNETN